MMHLDTAIFLAVTWHEGQVDKSGQPYILHPLRVMLEMDGDPDAMIVAVLHDVFEDTEFTFEEFADYDVPDNIFEALKVITRPGKDDPDRPTYKQFIRGFAHNELARKVKLMDVIDNTRPTRMATLDPKTRRGLSERYEWAMEELINQETAGSLPNSTVDMRKLFHVVKEDEDDV
jgi:(p)ppGpp synthase/HD superfamily hydrolase